MGERRLAGGRSRRPGRPIPAIVRDTPDDAHAARRAAGEHAPGPAQPAGRGGGLPAAARGVRHHARGAGPAASAAAGRSHQHDPAAEPPAAGAAPGRRRRAVGRARPGAARAWTTPTRRTSSPAGSSPRGCRCGRPRRSWPSRPPEEAGPSQPATRGARRVTAPALAELADRLSDAFDTRVRVELGRRKGKIVVEFASIDDLERIVGIIAPDGEAPPALTPAARTPAPTRSSRPASSLRPGSPADRTTTASSVRARDDQAQRGVVGRL